MARIVFIIWLRAGYYDDSRFFRVSEGRWAQFGVNGDPKISNVWRTQTIPDDPRRESNVRGTVAFAFAVPNGRTTQVFINLRDNSATHDSLSFVPFGKVVEGMDVADSLNAEYGETAGSGIRSGKQGPLYEQGNVWLEHNFPALGLYPAGNHHGAFKRGRTMKLHALFDTAAVALFCFLACPVTKADSRIQFGGVPVELTISQVSAQTLRVELSPLDAKGQPKAEPPSSVFVPFSSTEKLRVARTGRRKEISRRPIPCNGQAAAAHHFRAPRGRDARAGTRFWRAKPARTQSPSKPPRRCSAWAKAGRSLIAGDNFYPMRQGEGVPTLATDGARIPVPFLIGADGWALFLPEPRGAFDLRGTNGVLHPRPGATPGRADVFVVDAREPADAMREFTRLTGAPVMPPKWALGYMQSHRTLSTEADILAEARTFREKQLPCDTFIFLGTGFCPAGWNFGHDSFQFNTNVFVHDAATVIQELHANNLHVVLHVVPLQRDYPSLHGQIPPAPDETLDKQYIGSLLGTASRIVRRRRGRLVAGRRRLARCAEPAGAAPDVLRRAAELTGPMSARGICSATATPASRNMAAGIGPATSIPPGRPSRRRSRSA